MKCVSIIRLLVWAIIGLLFSITPMSPDVAAAQAVTEKQKRPNVLFIAVDDLNDWIGCLGGHPDAKTPNIDRLAARGVLFANNHCAAPACNPSRVALLSGVRPSTSGVYLNPHPWRKALANVTTMPRHFMKNDYHVIGCGKVYHGAWKDPTGWHEYLEQGSDPFPKGRPINGLARTAHFDWGPVDVKDDQMDDHRMVSWAVEQLGKKHDKPLFLACGIYRPHLPWYVPNEYFQQYPADSLTLPVVRNDDLDDVPPIGRQMAKSRGDHRRVIQSGNYHRAVQGYLASMAFADRQVGRLLDALDKSPEADNTIVILWGDHGWHLGEKLHWRKFSLWEEATRCPLMLVVPGLTPSGEVCRRSVSLLDIYPTLVELCGLPVPAHLEGDSFTSLLRRPDSPWNRPVVTTHGRENHAVRDQRWRYIRYRDGTEELYDHQNDPQEWTNLADKAEFSGIKTRLAQSLPTVNAADVPRPGRKKAAKQTTN